MINCECFNNLNENGDMAGTGIMAGICTSPYSSPYPTEKVEDSPYPYPYPVNAGISRQNGDGFGQYSRGRVYLSSLVRVSRKSMTKIFNLFPIYFLSQQLCPLKCGGL